MSSNIAAKVFAIPELLENILFQLTGAQDLEENITFKPALSLFGMLRVSKGFRDTIEGSMKLKRLMFLAPIDSKYQGRIAKTRCAPAAWLFGSILYPWTQYLLEFEVVESHGSRRNVLNVYGIEADPNDDENSDINYFMQILEDFKRRGGARAEASWRRMKVSRSCDEDHILVRLNVTIGNRGTSTDNEVWWDFKADTSLGAVYDKWVVLVRRLNDTVSFFRRYNEARDLENDLLVHKKMGDVENLLR